MGATRVELRLQAAFGELKSSPVIFEPCQSLQWRGFIFVAFSYSQWPFQL